jgi:methionine-rich copper-binding protein CopC
MTSTARRTGRRASVLAGLAGTVLVIGAPAASAHTDFADGTPGPGDAVDAAVHDLTLSFNTPLVAEGTEVVVRDPAGSDHATTTSTLGPEARVALTPLTRSGTYVVTYRAVAGDGHPVTGSYRFRVTGRGAQAGKAQGTSGSTTDAAASTPVQAGFVTATTTQGSAGSSRVVGLLGAGTLVALLIAGARRRPEHVKVHHHDDRA